MANVKITGAPDRDGALLVLESETEGEYYPAQDTSVNEDALCYQPTELRHLKVMLKYLRLNGNDVFVDLGCGKGRVVCFAAMHGVRKVIGVELRKELADTARKRIAALAPPTTVEIHHGDAALFYTEEGTVYYLFNPFGEGTVREVIGNIERSLYARPRTIRLIYNNSVHYRCLDDKEWLVREGQVPDTNMVVWTNVPR